MPYIENQPTQLFLRGMTAFYAHHNAPILCVHNKTGDVNDIPGPLSKDYKKDIFRFWLMELNSHAFVGLQILNT